MNIEFYKRNLPHFQTRGQIFFVTWVLASAIPKKMLKKLESKNEDNKSSRNKWQTYFKNINDLLNDSNNKSDFLQNPRMATIVANTLKFWDNKRITLYAFSIMPNHVHTIMEVYKTDEQGNELYLAEILESIKKFSARECNKVLHRSGRFWQHESFDRIIRNREDLYYTINYILDNPVKAGLCKKRKNWKWSYVAPEFKDLLYDEPE